MHEVLLMIPWWLWAAIAVCTARGIAGFFEDAFARRTMTIEDALELMRTPRQLEGGNEWLAYEYRLVPCDPPAKGKPKIVGEKPAKG